MLQLGETVSEPTRCPECGAPATFVGDPMDYHNPGKWRYDADAVIAQRVDALTPGQVVAMALDGATKDGFASVADFRAALRSALLGKETT